LRIKSLVLAGITAIGMVGFLTAPAEAAFVRVCLTNSTVTFASPLNLALNNPTININDHVSKGVCRQVNSNGTVGDDQSNTTIDLPGTATGNCILALLNGPYYTGVLVGGSVWVSVDQGAGFTAAIGAKVLVPNVVCSETSASGPGVGVIIGAP